MSDFADRAAERIVAGWQLHPSAVVAIAGIIRQCDSSDRENLRALLGEALEHVPIWHELDGRIRTATRRNQREGS